MDTKIVVTKSGKKFAEKEAANLRKSLKATIDKMEPADLLVLWAQLGDQKPSAKGK